MPLLYTGVEYGLTNNSKLAERFFSQALEIAPDDPFVLHELGVTSFQKSEYEFTFARISESQGKGKGPEKGTLLSRH